MGQQSIRLNDSIIDCSFNYLLTRAKMLTLTPRSADMCDKIHGRISKQPASGRFW